MKSLQWLTLPSTPTLPESEIISGYALINGVKIWYAVYGHGQPIILLHGGLANSNYWGYQVAELAKQYQVIVMDSRGHGRSTRDEQPYSYSLMASDVIGLMDFLKIEAAVIIGWSDGAILGLDIALHHPERLTKVFAFAANSDPSAVKDISKSEVFNTYIQRAQHEYEMLSTTPSQYDMFLQQISDMWSSQPNFTKEKLNAIKVPTWIVSGEYDEAVKRENTEFMAAEIPEAVLLIQPDLSHFSFLQDPRQFNKDVLLFLKNVTMWPIVASHPN